MIYGLIVYTAVPNPPPRPSFLLSVPVLISLFCVDAGFHSTAEMICAGVLPIMQMRNVMPPMTLIARRIPRHILELTYTIKLPTLPGDAKDAAGKPVLSPQQLLESYCQARGMFRARALGESDMPRAARQILKDFTDGRLLFCHPPPSATTEVGISRLGLQFLGRFCVFCGCFFCVCVTVWRCMYWPRTFAKLYCVSVFFFFFFFSCGCLSAAMSLCSLCRASDKFWYTLAAACSLC